MKSNCRFHASDTFSSEKRELSLSPLSNVAFPFHTEYGSHKFSKPLTICRINWIATKCEWMSVNAACLNSSSFCLMI